MNRYQESLAENTTLCVFNHDELIFSDAGRWLHPLFALEKFLAGYTGPKDCLSAHDTAAGKAAALLMSRLGIKRAHINLISETAIAHYQAHGIEVSWEKRIPLLACKTETLLSEMGDEDQMYRELKRRAKLVQGIAVEVADLSFAYPGQPYLVSNLSFSLPEGGRLIIQGDNGKGKTTLLNLLMGKLKASAGSILIDGRDPGQLPARTIGYIRQQQTQQQFPVSAREVVSMAVNPDSSKEEQKWEIDTAMRRTGIAHLAQRNFFTLSGGERQKVSLARSLCQKARLLLLDEPTSFLDAKSRRTLIEILHSLTLQEMPTIIIVTHDKELEADLCWPILHLEALHG
ncbi:MAG: DUF1893 domain-containing protein [Sphaerochaeta sp.]